MSVLCVLTVSGIARILGADREPQSQQSSPRKPAS
jgi:hypothetical protein